MDPNRDGYVSLQEYMAFMISKETENVQSSEEIENAFRAITAADRPYVTKEELYAVSAIQDKLVIVSLVRIYCFLTIHLFSEPYQGNGRLLRCPYEAVRRPEDRTTDHRSVRLY